MPKTTMNEAKVCVAANAATTNTKPTRLLAAQMAAALRSEAPTRSRAIPPARLPSTPGR